jgi:uncharacterized protein (DUF2345 family)
MDRLREEKSREGAVKDKERPRSLMARLAALAREHHALAHDTKPPRGKPRGAATRAAGGFPRRTAGVVGEQKL